MIWYLAFTVVAFARQTFAARSQEFRPISWVREFTTGVKRRTKKTKAASVLDDDDLFISLQAPRIVPTDQVYMTFSFASPKGIQFSAARNFLAEQKNAADA